MLPWSWNKLYNSESMRLHKQIRWEYLDSVVKLVNRCNVLYKYIIFCLFKLNLFCSWGGFCGKEGVGLGLLIEKRSIEIHCFLWILFFRIKFFLRFNKSSLKKYFWKKIEQKNRFINKQKYSFKQRSFKIHCFFQKLKIKMEIENQIEKKKKKKRNKLHLNLIKLT